MKIKKLFEDAIIYPSNEWKKMIILGIIFLVISIFNILPMFGIALNNYIAMDILNLIYLILLIVFTLIISGYTLSITRMTINNVGGNAPEFDWVKNITDGVKVLILTISYYIIPALIILIVLYATGTIDIVNQLINTYVSYGSINPMLESISTTDNPLIFVVLMIASILYILFSLLFLIGKAVLAETNSLIMAVNMIEVLKKIAKIGWKNYVFWLIIFLAISYIIGIVSESIAVIPLIGIITVTLIINPYVEMFSARSLGLIYKEYNES
ncbi:MAG: DUF4013 domain-containing protein [Methanobrevibacter sp.]|nr:DUF4013 domain-containing protein [Methanobrevibacter sp.]